MYRLVKMGGFCHACLGGGFIFVSFSPLPVEMIQFDKRFFQRGSTTN